MEEYTFTVKPEEELKFRAALSRLEDDEYVVIKELHRVKPEDGRHSDYQAVIQMDPEAALTFRLGVKEIKIRRTRTEEELAEEKRINDQNTVKITVKVDGYDPNATP